MGENGGGRNEERKEGEEGGRREKREVGGVRLGKGGVRKMEEEG